MSQFPLEGGGPNIPVRMRQAPRTPEVPQNVTPTFEELPLRQTVYSSGEQMASDLERALVGTAAVFGRLGDISEAGLRETERQDRLNAARDAEASRTREEFAKGIGAQRYHEDRAVIASDFANGKLPVPLDDPKPVVDDLIASRTEGMDPQAAQEYRRLATGEYTALAVATRDKMRDTSRAEGLDLLGSRAINAESPEELRGILDRAREIYPNASDAELAAAVPLRAMVAAAHVGDEKLYTMAKEVLGDRFPDKQIQASLVLRSSLDRAQTDVDEKFQNDIAGMYGKPTEIIRDRIESWQGKASPDRIRTELRSLDAEDRRQTAQMRADALALDIDTKKLGLVSDAASLMRSAAVTGGAAVLPERLSIVDMEGKAHDVPRAEIVQEATSQEMLRIARTAPKDHVLSEQVRFLGDNGVVYEPWRRVMEAGPMVASIDASKASPKDIPTNLAQGYALAKSIGAIDPRLLDRHLDPVTSKFYETAQLAEKYITPGDPNAAVLMAMRANKREPFSDKSALEVRSDLIRKAVSSYASQGHLWWRVDVQNANEVGSEIERVADAYMHTLGISPESAVKEAAKRVESQFTPINGWAVPTRGASVPRLLTAAAPIIADRYAKKYGKEEGLDAADLVLQPADVEGLWVLWNKATLTPVRRWSTDGSFTSSDFGKLLGDLEQARIDKGIAAAARGPKLPGSFRTTHDVLKGTLRDMVTGQAITADLAPAGGQ